MWWVSSTIHTKLRSSRAELHRSSLLASGPRCISGRAAHGQWSPSVGGPILRHNGKLSDDRAAEPFAAPEVLQRGWRNARCLLWHTEVRRPFGEEQECGLTLRCTRPATAGFARFRRRVNSNGSAVGGIDGPRVRDVAPHWRASVARLAACWRIVVPAETRCFFRSHLAEGGASNGAERED